MAFCITSTDAKRQQTTSVVRYFAILLSISFVSLFTLALLKFSCEHLLAPHNMGISGALVTQPIDLLMIGSSHTRQSYDLRTIEQGAGVPCFLIAYTGMDLVTIDQLVSYMISHGKSPRYIVVEAYSALLSRKPDIEDPRAFFDSPPDLKREMISTYLSVHTGRSGYLDIADLILSRGSEAIITYPVNSIVLNRVSYRGGVINKVVPGVSQEEFVKFRVDPISDRPNPHQYQALDHLLEITTMHNVHTIFIESPMPSPVVADHRIQTLKSDFRQKLQKQHVIYIDGDLGFPINDPALFADNNHLSSKGRTLFSIKISELLRKWIEQVNQFHN